METGGEVPLPKDELMKLIREAEKQMKAASKNLEFEKAAMLRDQVIELRRTLALEDTDALFEIAGRAALAPRNCRGGPIVQWRWGSARQAPAMSN